MRLAPLTAVALIALAGVAVAEEASVSATLSSSTASIGEAVELQIAVHGSQDAAAPKPAVDGLNIQYVGPSTQVQINNFEISRSVTHTYTVLPQREGTFTIPALRVDVGGRSLSTSPLRLTVSNGANAGSAGAQGTQGAATASDKIAFAEWVLPKTSAYVGEAIPAELRLYVASNVRCNLEHMPALTGDGFIVQKMPNPSQAKVTKDGRRFEMVSFKTAITPVKSGKLIVPATEINILAVLPMNRSNRQRRLQMPGFPDIFDDPFFNQAAQQQVVVKPDPVEMEIKPLPTGKPKGFSGAVGQFTLVTKAAPLHVHVGDPVTATAEVSGVGNFDRMGAPAIAEEAGWRAYPPSSKFKADDEIGISGTKTFETALIPDTTKAALPRIEFTYFDPAQEKYITLTGDKTPLLVEGTALPSPTPYAVAASNSATPGPTATPQPKPNDIQYIRLDSGQWGGRFEPVWRDRTFWLYQTVPLTAFLIFIGWHWRQARSGNSSAKRQAALREEKTRALRRLRQESTTAPEFFDAAMRVIQLETALNSGRDPATVDAETACASRKLDAPTAAAIASLFAAHDELSYAGAGAGGARGDAISPERRDSVLQLLETFEKSHA